MSKKKNSNFFSKFFKKKDKSESLDDDLFGESDDSVDEYEDRYHGDDDEPTVALDIDEPEEVFDAKELTASDIATNLGDVEEPEVTEVTEVTSQFQSNFNLGNDEDSDDESDEEVFQVEETPPLVVDDQGEAIPNLPSDDDLAEPTMSQFSPQQQEEMTEEKEAEELIEELDQNLTPQGDEPVEVTENIELPEQMNFDEEETEYQDETSEDNVETVLTSNSQNQNERTEAVKQPIDLDAINNYELTSDDDVPDETFAAYKMLTKKENKGLKAFFDKGKNELGKVFKGDYKNLLKNVKRPKSLKSSNLFQNIKFDRVLEGLYSPSSRARIHQIFIATMLFGGTYSTGKLIALSVKGAPNTQLGANIRAQAPRNLNNVAQDVNQIRSANIFNALMNENQNVAVVDKPKVIDENILCQSAQKASSLPLKLKNTLVLQDSVKSVAAVQIRSNKIPLNVREGEKLENIAKVGKIDRLKVIFKNLKTGECEFIESKTSKPRISTKNLTILNPKAGKKLMDSTKDRNIKNEGNVYNIKKSVRDNMLSNISEVLTQARAIQIKNPDGSYSFKMTEIVPGSIYSKLGIQDGDIVTEIDGKKITNLNEIMAKFGTIKDKDHFSLGIKRNGSTETKEYNFE